MMSTVLKFGKRDYKVAVKETSIWYSNKADKNIIFSNTVKLSALELDAILRLYLNEIKAKKIAEGKLRPAEIYTVYNVRNSKMILKTPDINEAKGICDKNSCCVILNRAGDCVYKSSFGKVRVPYKKDKFTSQHKAHQEGNNGVFNITQK